MKKENKKANKPINPILRPIAKLLIYIYDGITKLTTRNKYSIQFKISFAYLKMSILMFFFTSTIIEGAYTSITFYRIWEIAKTNQTIVKQLIESNKTLKEATAILDQSSPIPVVITDENKRKVYFTKGYEKIAINPINYYTSYNKESYLLFKTKTTIENQQYTITVFQNISREINMVLIFGLILLVANSFGITATMWVASSTSKKVLKPLYQMTQTVKQISANNLNLRINVEGTQDELKELAQTVNETMDKIEVAYLQQQQFVSDASHELRTPIAVILGYANMLDRWGKNDPAVLQESIDSIKNETNNMKDLVEKLLFLARNDKKTLVLQKENFDLNELLMELQKETLMIYTNHKINFDLYQGQKVITNGDKNRIKQLIRIIIENAVKYTELGGIINVALQKQSLYSIITIQDSGLGISKQDLPHIFDRFYRADKSRTKQKGGHGLGLAIAKIIVLSHNGKIKVKSKEGEGTTFQIYL